MDVEPQTSLNELSRSQERLHLRIRAAGEEGAEPTKGSARTPDAGAAGDKSEHRGFLCQDTQSRR